MVDASGVNSVASHWFEAVTRLWSDKGLIIILIFNIIIIILKSKKPEPPNRGKIFAKLVMEGQINSAMRYLSEEDCGGLLPLSDDVMRQLMDKHPSAQGAQLGALLFCPVEDVPHILYHEINREMVRKAALKTKVSGGPSGVDANGLIQKDARLQVFQESTGLCGAIAVLVKRLCTEFIDPLHNRANSGKSSYPTRQRKWRSAADWCWRSDQENNRKVFDESGKARYR